jgi:hypothetical protein
MLQENVGQKIYLLKIICNFKIVSINLSVGCGLQRIQIDLLVDSAEILPIRFPSGKYFPKQR